MPIQRSPPNTVVTKAHLNIQTPRRRIFGVVHRGRSVCRGSARCGRVCGCGGGSLLVTCGQWRLICAFVREGVAGSAYGSSRTRMREYTGMYGVFWLFGNSNFKQRTSGLRVSTFELRGLAHL